MKILLIAFLILFAVGVFALCRVAAAAEEFMEALEWEVVEKEEEDDGRTA